MAIVLLNYSRSGGTLLSSLLGRIENVILVSEVNPIAYAYTSIKEQVKDWYGIDISDGSFTQMILELNGYCIKNNKTLIIRDYSFVDFTPHSVNNYNPNYNFSTISQLQGLIPLRIFSFVRDAYDIWISRNCPPQFSEGYIKFAERLIELQIPIFKYEDFCDNPEIEFSNICNFIGATYKDQYLEKPNTFLNVTGDNLIEPKSRGRQLNQITRLKRKQIPRKWVKYAMADLTLHKANKLLNYPSDFNAVKMEIKDLEWVNYLKWKLYQYRSPSHFHDY